MSTWTHSELSIWPFGISFNFIERAITGYHGLLYTLPYMLPYFYENPAPFLLGSYFQHITRSDTECCPIHFQ